jgi:GAF domain-containing protein
VPNASANWSTVQLTEFMARVSSAKDEESALRVAVERAAEALAAEVGAVVSVTLVKVAVGFPRGEIPEQDLIAAAEGRIDTIAVPGAGDCQAVAVPLEVQPAGWLIVARAGAGFDAGERALLRGMVRILALTQRMLRVVEGERSLREKTEQQARQNAQLLASLQERQRLFDRMMEIQRLIAQRTTATDVFDAITRGASELIGNEPAALRLLDGPGRDRLMTVSAHGLDPDFVEATRFSPPDVGASGKAVSETRLILIEGYPSSPEATPEASEQGLQAAMAAPVYDNEGVIGSLTVVSHTPGRTYSRAEQDVLVALAQHASLVLPKAREDGFAIAGAIGNRSGLVA